MYTITFYSFKGGVGRSLSLANTAVELIKRGKTVLLVDFDLEAPGLDAVRLLRPPSPTPGMVEFISEYVRTGSAPNVGEYLCRINLPKISSPLWLMPSGIRDRTYSSRLQAINWQRLYSDMDGFLLLEDLKAQWEAHIKPDYVLIDSRTGHTDVAGICTRQLPDAVVICFLPNMENVTGLEAVVEDIRREVRGPRNKEIELFFVATNVPNLDDEDQILTRLVRRAQRKLNFRALDATIHRYDSLSLLKNPLFSLTRPKSRLAKQYKQLASIITRNNLDDRDVVLSQLNTTRTMRLTTPSLKDSKLEQIRRTFNCDGEVLYSLASYLRQLGRDTDADAVFAEAEERGYRSVDSLLAKGRKLMDDDRAQARAILRECLLDDRATFFQLNTAVRLLLQVDSTSLALLRDSVAFKALDPIAQISLCSEMFARREALTVAEDLLRSLSIHEMQLDSFRNGMMLCLIGQRKFTAAMEMIGSRKTLNVSNLAMADAFNYAMAEWGLTGKPPADLFQRVVDCTVSKSSNRNLNQCLAIANWAVSDLDAAMSYLNEAKRLAADEESESFSGWRYLQVDAKRFAKDLNDVGRMIAGEKVLPALFADDNPL